MRTKILPCCKCGESNYTDYMGRIDGRIYCQSCYDDKMDGIENAIIEECFLQNNFDLDGNRRG